MNFVLSEEQVMFRDMARKFAEQEMLPTLKDYERQRKINFDLIKKNGCTWFNWYPPAPGIWGTGYGLQHRSYRLGTTRGG